MSADAPEEISLQMMRQEVGTVFRALFLEGELGNLGIGECRR